MTKQFTVRIYIRENGTLNQYLEKCEATSLSKVIAWGKAIAKERGGRFVNAWQDEKTDN